MARCLTGGASPLIRPSPEETAVEVEAVVPVATVEAAVEAVMAVVAVTVATVVTAAAAVATVVAAVVMEVAVVLVMVAVALRAVAGEDRLFGFSFRVYFCLQVVLCFGSVIILLVVELYAGNCPWSLVFDVTVNSCLVFDLDLCGFR